MCLNASVALSVVCNATEPNHLDIAKVARATDESCISFVQTCKNRKLADKVRKSSICVSNELEVYCRVTTIGYK